MKRLTIKNTGGPRLTLIFFLWRTNGEKVSKEFHAQSNVWWTIGKCKQSCLLTCVKSVAKTPYVAMMEIYLRTKDPWYLFIFT